jgi:hypothetical protein
MALPDGGLHPTVFLGRNFDSMTRIQVGEDMPVVIVGIVYRYIHTVTALVRVFFKNEAVILVEHGFAKFAAMRLGDFDFPGRHGILEGK